MRRTLKEYIQLWRLKDPNGFQEQYVIIRNKRTGVTLHVGKMYNISEDLLKCKVGLPHREGDYLALPIYY